MHRPTLNAPRLEWALFYVGMGWQVFPLARFAKKPPAGTHGVLDATSNLDQIRSWWEAAPDANIGIATGSASGIVVLDEDVRNGGDANALQLPTTLQALTWTNGRHFYFAYGGPLRKDNRGAIAPGIDVQADGAYVVAPPSIVRDGGKQGVYRWWDEESMAMAPLPQWVVDRLSMPVSPASAATPVPAPAPSADSGEFWLRRALAETAEGRRNEVGLALACQLRDSGMPEADAEQWLRCYQAQVPGEGYSLREALTSVKSAYARTPRPPARRQGRVLAEAAASEPSELQEFHRTEFGNSERFIARHGAFMRWTREFGWLHWNEHHWCRDAEPQIRELAKNSVRSIYIEASHMASSASGRTRLEERKELAEESEQLLKWAIKSETDRVVNAMVNLASSSVVIDGDAFDQDPWLFNAANGTVDLRTGRLRDPEPSDLLMQTSAIPFDPHATCPTFERFLREIMCGREDLVAYLQRALGYSLTGDVREQVWHLCVGEGANGKSTLFELIEYVLGDYAAMMSPDTITLSKMNRDGAAPSPDIARLKGKRFCKVTETEEGARIAPARIKSLTGGDMLIGRHLHHDPIEFRPTLKIWVYTNHRPQVRETTHAFWRRVRYIPFDFHAGDNADPTLPEKLRAEAPGVLAWLVAGCLEWQRQGLNPPTSITEATGSYRDAEDTLKGFLTERCTLGDGLRVTASALFAAYTEWCQAAHEPVMNQKRFAAALQERNFERARMNRGFVYNGIGLDES